MLKLNLKKSTLLTRPNTTIKSSHPESHKVEAAASFGPAHDVQEVRCEDEWDAFPVHAKEVLGVAQDVAKVNVKKVP